MKIRLILVFVVCFSPISFAKNPPRFPYDHLSSDVASKDKELLSYETNYYTQILDHFNYNPQSYQTFQQRYLLNDKYWGGSKNNAPIFVYTVLAAWFRLKYPHVTIGALASSAPILNFANITSPYTFNNIITQDFKGESENCYKVIKGTWKQIEDTAKTAGGLEKLRKSFRICKNYISQGSLENWLSTAFVYTAMTDYPTPSNFLNPLPAYPVKEMCKAIDDPKTGNDMFEKVYGAANIYYNYTGNVTCFDLNDDSDPHGLGGWTWQACTEMVMPTDGNSKESIFPPSKWDYNERARFCQSTFGVKPRPDWVTTEFGGYNIERVLKRFGSNIIFFNGLRDPWSGAGVLKDISKSIVAIIAKEGAHHVDLRWSSKEDPEWLRQVRGREVNIISNWLSQYYQSLTEIY
ncbi:hypothetical protein HAX54_001089 [Datura stramonium]|uniref:Lysosomal Pro-X carboxypeptidase n=1 Tax=Datura stramonium TaxID=4076 RepID=A0ABS8RS99_DATST|nr:hypothetical protein [Datura stramonium]